MVNEVLEALPCLIQIEWPHALPKLVTDRFPEALAFSHGLRMVASGHDVLYSLLLEKALELGFSSPGKVLTALIGENLLRAPKALDTVEESFHDKLTRLLKPQAPANNVTTIIIQKDREIAALLVFGERKIRNIRLPELHWPGSLKSADSLRAAPSSPPGRRCNEILLFQCFIDGAGGNFNPAKASQEALHAPEAKTRIFLLGCNDLVFDFSL